MTRRSILVLFFGLIVVRCATCSVLDGLKRSLEGLQPYKLSGFVDDCCVDVDTVEHDNEELFQPKLQQLLRTTFFRIFKVNLQGQCKFWADDGTCSKPDCSVCECDKHEVPLAWRREDAWRLPRNGTPDCFTLDTDHTSLLDRTLDLERFRNWTDSKEEQWIAPESSPEDMTYVNLVINPERFTGYGGYSAIRIWLAIYRENCFQGTADRCLEERVFYRLISGLHASITAHISAEFCTRTRTPNLQFFHERLGMFPERINNIYFTLLFMLRAASKAANLFQEMTFVTGDAEEDAHTRQLVDEFLELPLLQTITFNETGLFEGDADKIELKQQFKAKFRNISEIMDCVSCEKCRMWGKLQILGIGTALKILFSDAPLHARDLERNEVIAFMNTIGKLSESARIIVDMRQMAVNQHLQKIGTRIGGIAAFILMALAGLRFKTSKRKNRKSKTA